MVAFPFFALFSNFSKICLFLLKLSRLLKLYNCGEEMAAIRKTLGACRAQASRASHHAATESTSAEENLENCHRNYVLGIK